MTRDPTKDFDRPWLLLCEGLAGKMFFHQLIGYHGVCVDQFNIYFPHRYGEPGGGKGKFGWYLSTASVSEGFIDNVKAVIIVADNDDDVNTSFTEIQSGLRQASFPVPDSERAIARKRDYPDVVVLMIPFGEPGNLETLCLSAAYNKWGLQTALDNYIDASPASSWSVGKQSKTRLHAILAATCETKPDTSFAHLWQEQEEFHIPLDDPCFTDLIEFLKNLDDLLSS